MQQLVVQNYNNNVLKVPPPILTRVFQELSNGIVGIVDAQKISDYPFPFPLAQMVSVMLIITAALGPLVLASIMESAAWSAALAFLTTFCFFSIHYIAAEIEMPFGDDPNDLPLFSIQKSLNTALIQLLDDDIVTCPAYRLTEDSFQCRTLSCPDWLTTAEDEQSVRAMSRQHAVRTFTQRVAHQANVKREESVKRTTSRGTVMLHEAAARQAHEEEDFLMAGSLSHISGMSSEQKNFSRSASASSAKSVTFHNVVAQEDAEKVLQDRFPNASIPENQAGVTVATVHRVAPQAHRIQAESAPVLDGGIQPFPALLQSKEKYPAQGIVKAAT
eukprot:TRINITY_DN37802_c0_g1_i1.p1 TRINITY_DN37802_c0_g1~~TRINITY_DN37802_c0_g1_i1.p1  ORF type:complete len:331 (+),score=44.81 TRINITY_DN37802_c0_g1_i1:296-1288(+)